MPRRDILGFVAKVLRVLIPVTGIVATLNIPLYLTGMSPFNQQYQALFWLLVVSVIFLTIPASKKVSAKAARWYDLLLVAITLITGLYIAFFYFQIQNLMGVVTPLRVILGILSLVAILESTRRVAGWPLVIIIGLFILYAKFGDLLPGLLETKVMSWPRLINTLYVTGDAWLGIPLRVCVMIVFGFLLFGRAFFETGGGDILINLAQSLMGRYRGGPAKVAVLASTFFGTMSGSAVANVAGTGVITIPMMKRTGYKPAYAGAVEATASTGGQILPPVMGAAAFIMAEFLGVSYPVIVLAAIVPGLLYYLGIYLQVDLQAVATGLKGLPAKELPSFKETVRKGWPFSIPLLFLIYALFVLWMPPGIAAVYSTGVLIVATLFRKETRTAWSWSKVMTILQRTSRTTIEVTAISAAAGLVVAVVSYTGLGLTFSRVLTELAGGNLFLLAVLTAFASICLGMGMPTTPTYILLAVLAAPALVNIGIAPVTAHLFVFYFGMMSMLTPPVCMSVYTAAPIAEARHMPVAGYAIRLAIAGYVVPFVMLYNPALNLIGSGGGIILGIFTTVIGISLFAFALEGYFRQKLRWPERGLFGVAAVAMLVPSWPSRLLSLAILVPLLLVQFRRRSGKVGENKLG